MRYNSWLPQRLDNEIGHRGIMAGGGGGGGGGKDTN